MFNRAVFLLLSLFTIRLEADPILPGVVAATDGDPSVMVGGCVNAITGDLVLGIQDLVVRGAVPLPITRSYASGKGTGLERGWQFFFPHFQLRFYHYDAFVVRAELCSPSGSKINYKYSKVHKNERTMEPILTEHAIGLTNNSRGLLSGRTNAKNNRLHFKQHNKIRKDIYFITGDGLRYQYSSRIPEISDEDDIHVLKSEELPNGCWILYEHDKYGRPSEARVTNPARNKTFSRVKFHYMGNYSESRDMWIETSDGRKIDYIFEKKKNGKNHNRFYLREVTGDILASERVHFEAPKPFHPLVTHISQGGTLLQKMVYQYRDKILCIHEDDERCNRVKELFRPSGPHGEEICTHQFTYPKIHWHKDMRCCKEGGTTLVNGPHGYKAEYRWTKELRPGATFFYDTESAHPLCMIHEYEWGPENTPHVGDLTARRLVEGDGRWLWTRRYSYDDKFNPLTEILHGNLTGSSPEESYRRTYTYSNDERNLLLEAREENGLITKYCYMPGTSLITAVLVGDGKQIGKRDFYEYDADHLLIAEISDDGTSLEKDNLTGITCRLVKRILRREDGMPIRIEERSGDGSLISATHFHYTADLLVSKQEIFGSNGQFSYSLSYTYNKQGLPVSSQDPLGRITTFTYDERGRLLSTCKPSGNIETVTYDAAGRIIATAEKTPSGKIHTTSSTYNALGFKTSTTNTYGHITWFSPDPLGRVKTTIYEDGGKEKTTYNAMGLPLQNISPNGDITTTTYNSYGKPITITYPDGTFESFSYDRDGTLLNHIDAQGTKTNFTYDFLSRLIYQTTCDTGGNLLTEEKNTYRGALLASHTNAEGEITEYEYDNAGRKIAQHHGGATTRWTYDPMGRESIIATASAETHKTYDSLGRVVREHSISKEGTLLHDVSYTYDVNDQILTTTTCTLQGDSVQRNTYDEWGRPILHTDPLSAETHIEWDETLPNLRKITTNPVGTKVIETIGLMERIISRETLSSSGERLSLLNFAYDKEGNCLEEETLLPTRTLLTKKIYTHGKITELIEASGTPEEKTTCYSYLNGLLSEVHKADGVTIAYSYDAMSRVAICQASTLEGYSYTYDRLSRILAVTDLTRGLTTTRSYDCTGNVREETFLHGLSIYYERDCLGKPLTFVLPDQSFITYSWEAGRIRSINRCNAQGDHLYTTTYDHYDLTSKPLSKTTPAGVETYQYDLACRLTSRVTPYHAETIKKRTPLGSPLEIHDDFNKLRTLLLYTYDPLEQLTSEWTLFHKHTHQFDAHGAPLLRDKMECHVNSLNQLQKIEESLFTYTPAGNLLSDGTYLYSYDAFDRLTCVEEFHKQKTTYIYDSWHRRLQKILHTWQGKWKLVSTHSYFYDGMEEIGSTDEMGNIVELRVAAPALKNEIVAIECRGKVYLPFHNIKGHIAGLVDAKTKTLIEVYRYSAFGELQLYDAYNHPLSTSLTGNPWRYFGKRMDEESGLTCFGRRYYCPKLGTWTTPDPAQTIDHANLYLFLRNNPIHYSDALGLLACPDNVYMPPTPNLQDHTAFSRVATPVMGHIIGAPLYCVSNFLPVPILADKLVNVGAFLMDRPNLRTTHSKFLNLRQGDGQYNCIYGNGIRTTRGEALAEGNVIANEVPQSHSVYVNYRAKHALIVELLKCFTEYFGISYHSTRLLERNVIAINEKAHQNGIEANYNLLLHSAGNFVGRNAFSSLRDTHPEINDHTSIYSFGTPIIIDDKFANYVETNISSNDGVGMLGRIHGILTNPSHQNFTIVSSLGGKPLCDHGFLDATYRQELDKIFTRIRGQSK